MKFAGGVLPGGGPYGRVCCRRSSVALLLLLIFFAFKALVVVPLIRSDVPFIKVFSNSKIQGESEEFHPRDCLDCGIDLDFNMTVGYMGQNGNINTFKLSAREFASNSIWNNSLSRNKQLQQSKLWILHEELQPANEPLDSYNLTVQYPVAKLTDPVRTERQVLRNIRRQKRSEALIKDKEAEMDMVNAAIYRSKNFNDTKKDSYGIWRTEFQSIYADATLKLMRDQIIMAKVYAMIAHSLKNFQLYSALMKCIRESWNAIGDANYDNELHPSALERSIAMGHILSTARYLVYNTEEVYRKLRVMLQSAEGHIDAARKQNAFLIQHAAKTIPKLLHCLHLQLSTHYYLYSSTRNQVEQKEKLEDTSLYHYAIFSDNVLATSVVVNSTVFHAMEPEKHIFHIVTDNLNFPAMTMWFINHSPEHATVHVENINDFKWLNSSYCSVLRQLESAQLKEFYFKAHHPSSILAGTENLKYRNPKYLSMLNHLRFYMPEVYPKLDKILFLDDDVVVQKDLTPLWSVDMGGMVNGAVETCKESFHRFDTYLNFSNPKIAQNFDPHACGWAFGMNIFDLNEWKRRNITGIYHYWQDLNEDRKLWKLGSLPPGLITFYNLTHPLDRSWHVLGLGYDPAVDVAEIEAAGVVHYNGNYKPWLDLAIKKYQPYWSRYVNYNNPHIGSCVTAD